MSNHPELVPFSGTVTVRWLKDRKGRCHARDFYDENPECKKSLLALARQMAIKGVVGKVPENGHKLQGEFSELWVLKPGDFRFIGFRHRRDFYLTNAAPKKDPGQEEDYRLALRLREEFLLYLPREL